MNIKVSVIVPVYNVSKYLRACLDSIVNQSLEEIEIIVVNDCSPDPQDHIICKEYEEKYDTITYIKLDTNKRAGEARNVGLARAKGAFVAFVDSDDFIGKAMYKTMYNEAVQGNFDMVTCNTVFASSYLCGNPVGNRRAVLDSFHSKITAYLTTPKSGPDIGPSSVVIISKRSIWIAHKIKYPENVTIDDYVPVLKLLWHTQRILFMEQGFYHINRNPNSLTTIFTPRQINDTLLFLEQTRTFLKEQHVYQKYKNLYRRFYTASAAAIFIKALKNNSHGVFFKVFANDARYRTNFSLRFRIVLLRWGFCLGLYKFLRSIYNALKKS